MADVSPPFGTLLIPNKTGDSQIEYPIEKTSVLIGRYVLDRDWDDPPGKSFRRRETAGPYAHALPSFLSAGTRRVISGSSTRRFPAGISSCLSTRMAA